MTPRQGKSGDSSATRPAGTGRSLLSPTSSIRRRRHARSADMSKTSDGPPNGPARSARRSMTATTTPRSTSLHTRGETTLHAVCAVADGAQSGLRSSGVQKQDLNPPPPLGATGRELGTSPRRLQQHQMLGGSPEAGTRRGGSAVKDTRTREHRISAEPLEPRDGVHKSKRQQTPRFRVTEGGAAQPGSGPLIGSGPDPTLGVVAALPAETVDVLHRSVRRSASTFAQMAGHRDIAGGDAELWLR